MILSIDIGTSLFKIAVINLNGKIMEKKVLPIIQEKSTDFLYYETNTQQWITALSSLIKQLSKNNLDSVKYIAVSGNGPTIIPVDANGKALMNAISWMDRRAVNETAVINEKCDIRIEASYALPKVFWLYNNKQKLYNKTKYFLNCPEYLNFLLTGEAYTILPATDYGKYIWSHENIKKLELDENKFPGFIEPGKIIGKTTLLAEKLFSLKKGIEVISGGPDFIMSLLGTGAVSPGIICDRSGSSTGINLCSPKYMEDENLMVLSHISENMYNISGLLSTTGKAIDWIKSLIKNDDYKSFFRKIDKTVPGAENLIFLPHLAGERSALWGPASKGAFVGLGLNHNEAHLSRAVLESIAFAKKEIIELMESKGLEVKNIRTTGRLSNVDIWNQIRADIIQKPVYTMKSEDSDLLGNACVVLKSIGKYDTFKNASEEIVKIDKEYLPDSGKSEKYNELYYLYKKTFISLKNVFEALDKNS